MTFGHSWQSATTVGQMPALGTKLRVPAPRRALVARARLANPFTGAGREWPRLVLIAAGAGFGKTTLLTQWLAGIPHHRVAWVALDDGDADVQQFLTALVASLARSAPDVGREATGLLAGERDAPVGDVVASLVNDLDQLPGATVIALDDYHRAGSDSVHEAVRFLLENLPPRVSVVLTTRADPPFPLARMRTRGELHEVRAAELRFTHAEAAQFLGDVMDLDLEPAEVGVLEGRTEGWVAGLQLAALSVRARGRRGKPGAVGEFVEEFSGSHRFVLDYLVEEVLAGLDEGTRRFLLRTCVLDALTGPLCDAVTGAPGGQRMLDELDRANLFLVPLDDHRAWYRYHHLFADALRARLHATHPGLHTSLHGAASRWYAGQGLLDEAVHHARFGADDEWLADVVEYSMPGLRRERRNRTIIERLASVPDAVLRTRAILAPARAWVCLSSGGLAGAQDWLDVAEELMARGDQRRPGDIVPPAFVDAREEAARTVPANVEIYRAAIGQASGDAAATTVHASRAQALAEPTDHLVRGAAAGFLGLASWAEGDLVSAVETFRGAVVHLRFAGHVTDQLGATVVLASMALALGEVAGARRMYEDALAAARASTQGAWRVRGDLHVGLAEVLREQGDLGAAAEHLRSAIDLGEGARLLENRFRLPVVQAGLLFAGGEFDRAAEQLERAQSLYLPGFFPDTRPLPALRARALIAGGRLDLARNWADSSGVEAVEPGAYVREFDLLTYARLVLAEHRTGVGRASIRGTRGVLDRLAADAEQRGRVGSVVEIRMVAALVAIASADRPRAFRDLTVALTVGVPAGFRRLFLDEGSPLQSLLSDYVAAGDDADAVGHARSLLADVTTGPRLPLPFGVEELSERELEVTRLLATDLSGPEIAAHLVVSVNTLRTHTRHIFTKLDVRTRRAAVTRARELGLV